jgi:hypothetical protein
MARIRSDGIVKCLSGQSHDADESIFKKYKSFNWIGTSRPNLDRHIIESFWFSDFTDNYLDFFDVDGEIVSPVFNVTEDYKQEWADFALKYKYIPRLSIEEQIANWTVIDRLLQKINPSCRKAVILYDNSRLARKMTRRVLIESGKAIRDILPQLGWSVFQVPASAPPRGNGDNLWMHYDRKLIASLLETWTKTIFGKTVIRLPKP